MPLPTVIAGKIASLKVFCGLAPLKYPRTAPKSYDFTSVTSIVQELTNTVNEDKLEFIQSVFVDNSQNPAPLSLAFNSTTQILTIPAYCQAYMPVLAINPPTVTLSTTGGVVVSVQWLSFPVPAMVWGASAGGNSGSGGVVKTVGNTGTDGSGTITTGATAQTLFGGATPTNGFFLTNPSGSQDLWISLSGTAAPNAAGSFRVAANGGYFETPANLKPQGPISIYGATTGQPFTAERW